MTMSPSVIIIVTTTMTKMLLNQNSVDVDAFSSKKDNYCSVAREYC